MITDESRIDTEVVQNVFTIDVEEWFQVYNLWGAIRRDKWESFPDRLASQMAVIFDLLDAAGCRATFFVLGWVAKHRSGVVKAIDRRGHEVANHGLNHDLLLSMTPERFKEETSASSRLLEDLTGKPVRGYRASNFSIMASNLWAFDVLAELGFRFDSSVYPIYRNRYGIATFPRGPVKVITRSGGSLVEFPAPTMKLMGESVPVAGGGFFRFWNYRITERAIKSLNSKGLPAVIYLHPWEFDPLQPRIQGKERMKLWMHYHNLHKTAPRAERILKTFSFTTMGELANSKEMTLPEYRLK